MDLMQSHCSNEAQQQPSTSARSLRVNTRRSFPRTRRTFPRGSFDGRTSFTSPGSGAGRIMYKNMNAAEAAKRAHQDVAALWPQLVGGGNADEAAERAHQDEAAWWRQLVGGSNFGSVLQNDDGGKMIEEKQPEEPKVTLRRNNRDYDQLARDYVSMQPYRRLDTEPLCCMCQREPCKDVIFPCSHKCVCRSCRSKHRIGESRQWNKQTKCPLCRAEIQRIIPSDDGKEVEAYWAWVNYTPPSNLPDLPFSRSFHCAAEDLRRHPLEQTTTTTTTTTGGGGEGLRQQHHHHHQQLLMTTTTPVDRTIVPAPRGALRPRSWTKARGAASKACAIS